MFYFEENEFVIEYDVYVLQLVQKLTFVMQICVIFH